MHASSISSMIEVFAWTKGAFVFIALCALVANSREARATNVERKGDAYRVGIKLCIQFAISCAWFAICLLLSGPGALYSILRAVPGFLDIGDGLQWWLGKT
eukprot:582566-Amphidinium_carterae.1